MASVQVSDARNNLTNFVLVIGCRTRNVLGEDGMHGKDGCILTSDEVRVVELNKLLEGKARVVAAEVAVVWVRAAVEKEVAEKKAEGKHVRLTFLMTIFYDQIAHGKQKFSHIRI